MPAKIPSDMYQKTIRVIESTLKYINLVKDLGQATHAGCANKKKKIISV